MEERDQEYVKQFELEDEVEEGLEDGVNDYIPEDPEEYAAYSAAATTTIKDGKKCCNSKLSILKVTKLKVINYSSTDTCFLIFN